MDGMCINTLTLLGDGQEIERFTKQGRYAKNLSDHPSEIDTFQTMIGFEKFIPLPKELKDTSSLSLSQKEDLIYKYGYDDPIRWKMANWGDVADPEVYLWSDKPKTFTFDTPDYPPIIGFVNISRLFPLLKFILEYKDFTVYRDAKDTAACGRLTLHDGNVISEKYWKARFTVCKHCGELFSYIEIDAPESRLSLTQ